MRLAENESRQVGMKFKALVELSRNVEGMNHKASFVVHTLDSWKKYHEIVNFSLLILEFL